MQEPVEHGPDRGGVAQELAPIFDRSIGRQQRTGTLVTTHDDLQQIFAGAGRQFAHPEVIDDEQRDGRDLFHVLLASAVEGGVGQFLQ
jgi:hypothetical protein